MEDALWCKIGTRYMALGPKWILDYHIKKHFHFYLFLLSFSKPIPFYLDVVLNVDFLYSIIWKSNMWGILYYLFPLLVDHLMLYLHVFINLLCGNMFLHNCLSSSITHIIMPQTIYIGSIYFLRQIVHFLPLNHNCTVKLWKRNNLVCTSILKLWSNIPLIDKILLITHRLAHG